MAVRKKKTAALPVMPYTGNTDPSDAARPGTEKLIEILSSRWGFTNLGIWANRPMRGSTRLSVHATGRAVDAGFKPERAALVGSICIWLSENYYTLGIEEIHDYSGTSKIGTEKWGRGFRCNRGGRPGWLDWTADNNGGTPGGKWLHIELAPRMADDPRALVKAWKSVSGTAPSPVEK
jgi:hypothetical protein